MSKINNEILEGNKLIAEFMGAKPYYLDVNVLSFPMMENPAQSANNTTTHHVSALEYHSSFDWQIPVYSKVTHLLKELLPKLPNPETKIKYYFQQERLYQNAVFSNEPESGQKVIVNLIKLYNQNKNHDNRKRN